MNEIPDGTDLLGDHESTDGHLHCRTRIWRRENGTCGTIVVQGGPGGDCLLVHLDEVPSLPDLDERLLAELRRRDPSSRFMLIHSAAGAYEKATQNAA